MTAIKQQIKRYLKVGNISVKSFGRNIYVS